MPKEKTFKYKLRFMRKDNGLLYRISEKVYNKLDQFVSFRNKKYHIPVDSPAYLEDNIFVYYVDIDSDSKYNLEEKLIPIDSTINLKEDEDFLNADQLTLALDTHIVKQVLKGASKASSKIDWLSVGVGVIIGLMIGCLVTFFFMQGKIDSLIESFLGYSDTTLPTTPF